MKAAVVGILLSFAALPAGAAAQKVDFNVRFGAGASTYAGADPQLFGVARRFAAGGGVGLAFASSDRVTVRPELLYLVKGATVAPDSGIAGTYRVGYLQVPILVDLYLPASGGWSVRPRAFAGPAVSLTWSCSWRSQAGTSYARCDPQSTSLSAADLGAIVGAGLDLPLGGIKGTLEARYDIGLRDVDRGPEVLRNRSLMVFAGISLPLHPTILPPDSI